MAFYVIPNIKAEVAAKTNNRCAYCGDILNQRFNISFIVNPERFRTFMNNHKENKGNDIPAYLEHLKDSDATHIDNMLASCYSCNKIKGTGSLEDLRQYVYKTISMVNRYNIHYQVAKRFGLIEETNIDKIVFYFETIDVYNTTRKDAV